MTPRPSANFAGLLHSASRGIDTQDGSNVVLKHVFRTQLENSGPDGFVLQWQVLTDQRERRR